jgi:hypothetical protein
VITRKEWISVTAFCGQYIMVFLTHNLHSPMMKLGSIWLGLSVWRTVGFGADWIWTSWYEAGVLTTLPSCFVNKDFVYLNFALSQSVNYHFIISWILCPKKLSLLVFFNLGWRVTWKYSSSYDECTYVHKEFMVGDTRECSYVYW